jgi:ABC-type amino acid transport substrate-binding protein
VGLGALFPPLAVVALALVPPAGEEQPPPGPGPDPANVASVDPEPPAASDLGRHGRPLRVAVAGSTPPLHQRAGDRWEGFEPELAAALGERLGRGVVFVEPRDGRQSALELVATGTADVALSAITPTAEGAKQVDFTAPYAHVPLLLASRGAPPPADPAAVRGRRVAVAKGPALAQLAPLGAALVVHPDLTAAARAARTDRTLLVAGEAPRLRSLAARLGLTVHPLVVASSPVAMAVRKGEGEAFQAHLSALAPTVASLTGRWLPTLETYVAVAAGLDFACALTGTGKLHCFATSETRSLRNLARAGGEPITPLASVPAGEFVAVTAGWGHACALDRAGAATCWGIDHHGQCDAPRLAFRSLAAGAHHTCGLTVEGRVVCWGSDVDGQARPPQGAFTRLASGGHLACALDAAGRPSCWGRTRLLGPPPAAAFQDLAVSDDFACGLERDGRVQCWGHSLAAPSAPIEVPPVRFRSIAAGGGTACGIAEDGALHCWPGRWNAPGGTELTRVSVYDERGVALTPRARVGVFDLEGQGLPRLVISAADGVELVTEGEHLTEAGARVAICDRGGWTAVGAIVDGRLVEGHAVDPALTWYDGRSFLRQPNRACRDAQWVASAPIAIARDVKPGARDLGGGWTRTTLQWVRLEDGSRLGLSQLSYDPAPARMNRKAVAARDGEDVGDAPRPCRGYVVDWEPMGGSAQRLDLTDCPGD